jgi:hypothetical protein
MKGMKGMKGMKVYCVCVCAQLTLFFFISLLLRESLLLCGMKVYCYVT